MPSEGYIDFGESVLAYARREAKEEVGIEIKNLRLLGFTEDLFKKDKKHYITIQVKLNQTIKGKYYLIFCRSGVGVCTSV